MNHILFVCTGNIFRSMIAEHALRYTAGTTSDYSFSSAGTEASDVTIMSPSQSRSTILSCLLV